jgi:autoinducer 2-degrading protein
MLEGSLIDGDDDMNFVLAVMVRIKPENVEPFMAQVLANAREARKEPGCRQFEVLVDPADRTKVMLFEVYDDEKAFEAHQQGAHFKDYLANAVPLLASRERAFWKRAV